MPTPFGASLRPVFHSALALCALAFFVLAVPLRAATTYYVSPSGNDNNAGTQASPFKTIQQGITNAATGDTVTLMDGTYTGPGNVDLDALGRSITVNSVNGATATIIDCGGTSSANHRAFYYHSNEGASPNNGKASISGITMKNSYEGKNDGNGGAVYVSSGCTVTLANCVFSGNTNIRNYNGVNGGGVGNNGMATLMGCNFSGNTAGLGGGLSNTGTATLTGCTLSGNTGSNGGGIYNTGTLTLTNCTASSNSGDGVYNGGGLTMLNCTTSSNSGRGIDNPSGTVMLTNCTLNSNGGGFYNGYKATLTNCTISGNTITAGNGGGVDSEQNYNGTYLQMMGCTMAGNVATQDSNNHNGFGGGLYNTSSAATLMGCVISGSTAYSSGGGVYNSSQVTLTNCLITGNKTTFGNGGGVYNYPGDMVMLQFCTLSGNSTQAASSQGGALENDGTTTLTDDILWGNTAPSFPEIGISPTGNPVTTVTNCDIQGGYSGNLKADPLFVNAASDFHLKVGSPCIGSGVAITGPSGVPTDFDGKTRANPPTIGAYEGGVTVAGHTHLLWNNTDGRVMLWNVNPDGSFTVAAGYGPYTDNDPNALWTATALATGADGVSHILWNNTDHRVMLWNVNNDGTFSVIGGYGPYTDNAPSAFWSAVGLSVGPDNVMHLAWSNTDHRAMFWNVGQDGSFSVLAGYGPYTDDTPSHLWDVVGLSTGLDNVSHLLWSNSDHRAMFWDVSNTNGSFSVPAGYGPYTDDTTSHLWSAAGISTGPDNVSHLLWDNTNLRSMFWDVNNTSGSFSVLAGYGPYTDDTPSHLWSATALATGSDNVSHLLWNNTDHRVMLWDVSNVDGGFTLRAGYGPYTDNGASNLWSATAVSVGP